jgi:phage terminase large subunit-like protein
LLSERERKKVLESLTEDQATELLWDWRFWARPKQLPPEGDWATWVLLAGRGFGKTRSGCGWVHERAMASPGRWIAFVAKTPADARDYMIEGPGGIMRNAPPWERPSFEPSKRRLTWPNGSWATVYSDEEPEQTRGFSGDTAWLDEFAKFRNSQETWDNLQFGMREISNDRPRRLITTTPRPIPMLRKILATPSTVAVIGTSHENRLNLDPSWYAETVKGYEGTRLGRQEVNAEILDDVPGALWTRSMIDDSKLELGAATPDMQQVVVGVDPSGTSGKDDDRSDEVGIVVVGKGIDGLGYVLADYTCNMSPAGWGRRACEAYHAFSADKIVAEKNFGGDMVRHVINTADRSVPFEDVTASRGKVVRAQPIAALYEQKRFRHVTAGLAKLEDQMCAMTSDGYLGDGSPDRVDALVWAGSSLMLDQYVSVMEVLS